MFDRSQMRQKEQVFVSATLPDSKHPSKPGIGQSLFRALQESNPIPQSPSPIAILGNILGLLGSDASSARSMAAMPADFPFVSRDCDTQMTISTTSASSVLLHPLIHASFGPLSASACQRIAHAIRKSCLVLCCCPFWENPAVQFIVLRRCHLDRCPPSPTLR